MAPLVLMACGGDEGPAVGATHQCENRLERKLTDRYLRIEHEIASVDALTQSAQIARTCRDLTADFPLDDAAELVGGEIHNTIREETLE